MRADGKTVVLFAALLIYCFAFQGARGLFEKDEGRYTAIALNMLQSGDWIHPHLHSEKEHFSKPPMTYWAIAASLAIFGHSEFAARFPSAFGFLGSIIAVYFLGLIFLPQQRLAAPIIYATFCFVVTASNMITTDGLLTFFEIAAVACFARATWGRRERRFSSLLGMWFFFSLAFMTKGPPGLLPLLAMVIFVLLNRKNAPEFRMQWLPGILIFLTVGGGWYFCVMAQKAALVQYFLEQEVVHRVFSGEHNRNEIWYSFLYIYAPILIAGTLPWTKYAWGGVFNSLKRSREAQPGPDAARQQDLFLLLWLLVPLTVFVIARSRLALYVLPLFAPLALLGARELSARNVSLFAWRGRIVAWMLVMLALRFFGGQIALRQDASWYARELKKVFPGRVDAVVFIDLRPIYGLKFYTNADIKTMSLKGATFEAELKKPGGRLWILKPEHRELFRQRAEALGDRVEFVNTFQWDHEYCLFVEK